MGTTASGARARSRDEVRALLVAAVEQPVGQAPVVLRGEPGIGKTTLLEAGVEAARRTGATVLRADGDEAGAPTPYRALGRLLSPLVGHADRLSATMRAALLGALGLDASAPPDASARSTFHVALATLALLTSAGPGPVVVVLDDLHWFDEDSLAAVAFVARRVVPEPIVVLAATRHTTDPHVEDAVELDIGPLPPDEARTVLDATWPGLGGDARQRVLTAAAGNPLALVELPALDPAVLDESAAGSPFAPALTLTARLERAFAFHCDLLPPTTATTVLAAALNSGPSASEALRAAGAVLERAVDVDDLHPAVEVGLLELDGDRLRFAHPLMRSGVVQNSREPDRRALHRALADLLAHDPDRRSWHRAQVVDRDEGVAAELEAAAERADGRGAPEAALDLMDQAARTSPESAGRQVRACRAAELAVQVGRPALAARLLAEVDDDVVPWAAALRAVSDQQGWYAEDATPDQLLTPVREAADHGRPDLALRALEPLTHARRPELATRAAAEARRLFALTPAPIGLEVLARDPGLGRHALDTVYRELARPDLDAETRRVYATAASVAYDYRTALDTLPAAAAVLLAEGRRAAAGQALTSLATSELLLGRLSDARSTAERAVELCRETDQVFWTPGAVLVLAVLDGLTHGASGPDRQIAAALAETPGRGFSPLHQALALAARTAGALADSRYAEAADRGRDMLAVPSFARWWGIADHVEASVRAGRTDDTAAPLAELDGIVATTASPFLGDLLRYGRALTADDEHADAAFGSALSDMAGDNPFLRGRVCFAHGVWLRRRRRVREARGRYEEARTFLGQAGPTLWDEKVTRELQATGGTGPTDHTSPLTPQEREVALLAADGLSNRRIAEHLVVSPRTVSTHLSRVFRKLGITQRRQLDVAALDVVGLDDRPGG